MPVARMLLILGVARGTAQPQLAMTIAWPDFFAAVRIDGLVYSEKLKALEGRRVRLRGYAIRNPSVPGGLLLSRDPYSDPHDVDETDVPYDVVGVVWKAGGIRPMVPARPTVEGTLRLGNRSLGSQIVAITLEDAVPVYPPSAGRGHP